jgi:hypothetical protein
MESWFGKQNHSEDLKLLGSFSLLAWWFCEIWTGFDENEPETMFLVGGGGTKRHTGRQRG